MDTPPPLTLRDLLTHVVGDMVKALCDRPSESPHQHAVRIQAATHTIMAFQPRDAIEAMLAGHCVMFHEMIVDSVHHTMRGEEDAARRATRSGIVAMDRAFGNSLARLERCRTRRAGASPEGQPTQARAETDIADRIRRHQSQSPARQAPAMAQEAGSAQETASETIAACEADPEAMAALDPVQFAKALGEDPPIEGYPAAATAQMSGFNGDAAGNSSQAQRSAYAGNRQARRHPIRNGKSMNSIVAAAN